MESKKRMDKFRNWFDHTYVMENQWNMQIGGKMNNEIIQFVNGDLQIDVTVSPNNETVWLTQKQMAELFDVKSQAITRHLKNIYNEEELIKEATCSKMEQVQI